MEQVNIILQSIIDGIQPKNDWMESLLQVNQVERQMLLEAARRVRDKYHGREIHLRAIIEFSSYCRQKCAYCGINGSNSQLQRFRMSAEEIVAAANEAYHAGYRTVILQSGEDMTYSGMDLAKIIEKIKAAGDIAITVSIGERSREDYRIMREAGADRYLLKHETCDSKLYAALHPGMTLTNRLRCAGWLKELGYQLGGGFMVGLPGQDIRRLAEDIRLLKTLEVEMAGIGPFIHHPDTPLADCPDGDPEMVLRAVAVARLYLPEVHLPVTTALSTTDKGYADLALESGANVIMRKVEPYAYRKMYEIYPKAVSETGTVEEERNKLMSWLKEKDFLVADSRGDGMLTSRT